MTPAFRLLKFINYRPRNESGDQIASPAIHDRFITALTDVPNEYGDTSALPGGTIIQMDFGGDFGFYGMADIDGVLTKCRISINEIHKLDWSPFQNEIDELSDQAA